jgi:hypothetical protein
MVDGKRYQLLLAPPPPDLPPPKLPPELDDEENDEPEPDELDT